MHSSARTRVVKSREKSRDSPIIVEKGRVSATLVLRQHVNLRLELLVRFDRSRRGEHLSSLDVVSLDAAQQSPHVVASLSEIHRLFEHLNACVLAFGEKGESECERG